MEHGAVYWWKTRQRLNDTTKLFPLRSQEIGTPFTWLQITRRRLSKEAHWGDISATLNVSTTANNSPLLFMSSKPNLPNLRTCWLPTWSPVSNEQERHESWLWVVRSIHGRVSSSAGEWMVRKEHCISLFFRAFYSCMLLTVVGNREGDVYVANCEYQVLPRRASSQVC